METLVAKCCALTFNIPSIKSTHPFSLSKVLDLTKGVAASSTRKKQCSKQVELVATGITLLGGGGKDTVVHKLLQYLDVSEHDQIFLSMKLNPNISHNRKDEENVTFDQNSSNTQEQTTCVDGSSLYSEFSGRVSPLHQGSLRLESYAEDSQHTSQQFKPFVIIPTSHDPLQSDVDKSSNQKSTPRTDFHLPPRTQNSSVHNNSTSPILVNSCEGEDQECYEYFTDLIKNNELIEELESDWESSQVELKQREFESSKRCLCSNTSIPTSSNSPSPSQHSYSYSEDILKELQEPFSQSREPSPLCVPVTKTLQDASNQPLCTVTDSTDTPGSTSEQSITANTDGSPELFSSVSSHASSLNWRRSGSRTGITPNQSQLLFDKRLSTSPELFGSMSSKSSHRNTSSQNVPLSHAWPQSSMAYKTPALPSRKKSHVPRRKLVQDQNSCVCEEESQHLLTPHSPVLKFHRARSRSSHIGLLGFLKDIPSPNCMSSPDLF